MDETSELRIAYESALIPQVQKLCELHRQGYTEALLRGLDEIISAIEAGSAITLAPNDSPLIADVVVRLERLESQALTQDAPYPTIGGEVENLTQTVNALTQRLNRLETTIAPLIHALEQVPQVGQIEKVGVEGADFEELEVSVEEANAEAITPTPLPPSLKYPLSQRQLSERLGQPQSYYLKTHREKGKEHFEAWSQSLDPDGIAWTFDEPKRRRGQVSSKALKFYPKS